MSENSETEMGCQIPCLPQLAAGYAVVPPESLARRMRLVVRRSLNARQVRVWKAKSSRFLESLITLIAGSNRLAEVEPEGDSTGLNAGDLVRVRSEEEIGATLNRWGQLKGCMFMPEMRPYCGTTQRVLKRLERFVDERDYHVKIAHGSVLLEGLNCQGTSHYGRCDRSCYYFWREEWLAKVEGEHTTA